MAENDLLYREPGAAMPSVLHNFVRRLTRGSDRELLARAALANRNDLMALSGDTSSEMGMGAEEDRLTLLPRFGVKEAVNPRYPWLGSRKTPDVTMPRAVYDVARAIKSAGNSLLGHETSPEEALNVAFNLMGGNIAHGVVKPQPGRVLGMFAGPKAKTANHAALVEARKLLASGMDDAAVWKKTGWWVNTPDGVPRFEISDKPAQFKPDFEDSPNWESQSDVASSLPLSEAYQHDALYAAYPELASPEFHFMADEGSGGFQTPGLVSVGVGKPEELHTYGTDVMLEPRHKRVLSHELQHAVQGIEGMGEGANPAALARTGEVMNAARAQVPMGSPEYRAALAREAYDQYNRTAGEAEARATEKRVRLDDKARRNRPPWESYDVPIEDLIVRRGGGMAAASAPKKPTKLTQVPSLRGLPVEEATAIAAREPHLIPSGEASEGYYVGGPRNIQNKRQLNRQRQEFDEYVGADPRGADWYDRYRAGVDEVTGGDPNDALWMSNQEGQWSAGVDPGSELQFALRENNASLMGQPVKSARPAQHEAHLRAIEANDPAQYQLGKKTGEYAGLINPNRPPGPAGATGVNDFRHAVNLGYTEPSGIPQRAGLTGGQHTFADYETALAVKRANETALGGRTDWTGEKLQAAPWVRQKAISIMEKRKMVEKYEAQGLSPEEALNRAYEDAFQEANKSITEHFPKYTMNATYEAQPGGATGHLPESVGASQAERDAFAMDPRSTWATAPGGRDALYAGLRLGDTGVTPRVRETRPMQGYYTGDAGLEMNLGEVARPMVSFVNTKQGKQIGPADRSMVEAGETLRAAIDAQDAGAAHIAYTGQKPGQSNSFSVPNEGPMSREQMAALAQVGQRHGLPDVSDTGSGATLTSFYPPPGKLKPKQAQQVVSELGQAGFKSPVRSQVDSVYADLKSAWKQGEGSGAVTNEVLAKINVTPEARAAFDNNPYLAQKAIGNLLRDEGMAGKWGISRKDLTTFRKIVGAGPGWVGRLEKALKDGVALPAVAGAVLLEAFRQQGQEAPNGA